MNRIKHRFIYLTVCIACLSWKSDSSRNKLVDENFRFAARQTTVMLDTLARYGGKRLPKSVRNGAITLTDIYDWTSGFFPGTLWYLYEYTKAPKWKEAAAQWTALLEPVKDYYGHHDIGFMMYCSYGNGYRLTGSAAYKDVLVQTARSLCKRFNPRVGCILSWDADKGWQSQRGWKYPVIIDNMMNLELLFKATQFSGDSAFYRVAVSHADKTLQHHFRPDYSSYHVVDYDPETGAVRHQHTAQGYAHSSAWARGQAWALYGFTFCYRETRFPRYLQQAERIADFILQHQRLPADKIPYWDFDAPDIPHAFRDASAGAIIASALLDLSGYAPPAKAAAYRKAAAQMLTSLSAAPYRAQPGTNHGFLLQHSVGSIPHKSEIDVPLVYADYYFLEALLKLKALQR